MDPNCETNLRLMEEYHARVATEQFHAQLRQPVHSASVLHSPGLNPAGAAFQQQQLDQLERQLGAMDVSGQQQQQAMEADEAAAYFQVLKKTETFYTAAFSQL